MEIKKIIKPLGDMILVKYMKKDKTDAGVYLPDNADSGNQGFKVIDKGIDVKKIAIGDFILFDGKKSVKADIEGVEEDQFLVKEELVLALLQDKPRR